jgi:DNA polymerase
LEAILETLAFLDYAGFLGLGDLEVAIEPLKPGSRGFLRSPKSRLTDAPLAPAAGTAEGATLDAQKTPLATARPPLAPAAPLPPAVSLPLEALTDPELDWLLGGGDIPDIPFLPLDAGPPIPKSQGQLKSPAEPLKPAPAAPLNQRVAVLDPISPPLKPLVSRQKTQTPAANLTSLKANEPKNPRLAKNLDELNELIVNCAACPWAHSQKVLGVGPYNPTFTLVLDPDDSPTAWPKDEAGQVLTRIVANVLKVKPAEVYVTPALKCHAPASWPYNAEAPNHCRNFLRQEVALVNPKVIIAMGETAGHILTETTARMFFMRLKKYVVKTPKPYPVKVTLSLRLIVDEPDLKPEVWGDLLLALQMANP